MISIQMYGVVDSVSAEPASRRHHLSGTLGHGGPSVRVAEYTSEFGRWDEVERAADPRLRPYVHGYFATSSSLVRLARERHLPAAEVPMVLNFGAPHTRVDDGAPQRLDLAWVSGLQTRYHLGEALGERCFMVVRFTPLGAHLFLRLSMDSLTDRAVPLDQVDPSIAALVRDRVMVECGWAQRFDAMEALIGSRVAGSALPTQIELAWNNLARTWGQTPVGWLAENAGCSHRHLIQQFRTCVGLPPKKVATLLRFHRVINTVTRNGPADSPIRPCLEGSAPPGAPGTRWANVAAECGYFDQPHFIHDFRSFTGATPSEFLRGIPTP
jgi:AraC-like DNA-binding protein